MVIPAAGDVVVVPFPFTDLSANKIRPAVVLAQAGKSDWILCQITSNAYADPNAIEIEIKDFSSGKLRIRSFARPSKLFTANTTLMIGKEGRLKPQKLKEIKSAVIQILS